MTKLESVPVDKLVKHPNNPRILMREDVVENITLQVKASGAFSEMYALIVRPVNGHFQIVSGHHRAEAAKRAKVKSVPCWIKDMDDEEAFMQLVLANQQGELSPLELGLHALDSVTQCMGGRGKKGGLSQYAKAIGKTQPYITQVSQAAEVYRAVKTHKLTYDFSDKAQHLAAIHKAPRELWSVLVEFVDKWSVNDAKHYVEKVCQFDVPEKWGFWLPLQDVVRRSLTTLEFSSQTVGKLVDRAEMIEESILAVGPKGETILEEFRLWLKNTEESWDYRKLVEYERLLKVRLEKIDFSQAWFLGDWRKHIESLKDDSVSLVLTDPPYGIDYKSDYKLDRREERKHGAISGDSVDAAKEVEEMFLAVHSKLTKDAHVLCFCHWSNEYQIRAAIEAAGFKVRGSLVWEKNNTGMGDPNTTFAPKHERIIHAVKGSPILFVRQPDVLHADRVATNRHPTEKPTTLLKLLIETTTVKGELVVDPFGGVASTPVAAKESERDYWACEVEEAYFNIGAKRLGD